MIGSNDHQRTTYILRHGKLVALPEGVMMIVPTRVMPMLAVAAAGLGNQDPHGPGVFPQARDAIRDRSVAEFVIDHFGQETLDYLAEPLLSGVYGGDPAQLSVGERAAALRRNGSEVREPGARA